MGFAESALVFEDVSDSAGFGPKSCRILIQIEWIFWQTDSAAFDPQF